MSIYELDAKVMELREIQVMIAELEAQAEAISDILLDVILSILENGGDAE